MWDCGEITSGCLSPVLVGGERHPEELGFQTIMTWPSTGRVGTADGARERLRIRLPLRCSQQAMEGMLGEQQAAQIKEWESLSTYGICETAKARRRPYSREDDVELLQVLDDVPLALPTDREDRDIAGTQMNALAAFLCGDKTSCENVDHLVVVLERPMGAPNGRLPKPH